MDQKTNLISIQGRPGITVEQFVQHSGVNKGWDSLITDLCEKLFEAGWSGDLLQCKEKFGTLRFYIDQQDTDSNKADRKKLYEIVTQYESRSAEFCELCGAWPAEVRRNRSWVKTFCDDCYEKDRAAHPGAYRD